MNRATPIIKNCASKLLYVSKQQRGKSTKEEVEMKKLMLVLMITMGLSQWGCEFIGGAAVGAGATGAGYEYNAYRQMQQLEEDYKNERISRAEYEERKRQIEAGSIIY
jgi:hypothetical protein